jgi:hypothetical protein
VRVLATLAGVSESAPAPTQRASDAEREAVADRLREAAAEGRLDHEELEERVAAAYGARTHGELAAVTEDLPAPPAVVAPRPVPGPMWRSDALRQRLAGFIIANAVCNAVWFATGADGDWWPMWVLLGTGIGLFVALVHAALGIEEPAEERDLPRPPKPPGLPGV